MCNRIKAAFEALEVKGEKAFIGYLTAGDPDLNKTEAFVYALEKGGANIIELGIPFSDPLADGPTIQEAGQRALAAGVTIDKILNMVEGIRKNTNIPLVFMVYYNTILIHGVEKFIKRCHEVGIDGIIVPDLPLEERSELLEVLDAYPIAFIPLIAPTSKDRIKKIIEGCSGFVYCVSSLGVTGGRSNFYEDITPYLRLIKKHAHIPIAVGFGISSREDIQRLENEVDGVIIGSAIMRKIQETNGDEVAIEAYIKELSSCR